MAISERVWMWQSKIHCRNLTAVAAVSIEIEISNLVFLYLNITCMCGINFRAISQRVWPWGPCFDEIFKNPPASPSTCFALFQAGGSIVHPWWLVLYLQLANIYFYHTKKQNPSIDCCLYSSCLNRATLRCVDPVFCGEFWLLSATFDLSKGRKFRVFRLKYFRQGRNETKVHDSLSCQP